MRFREDTIDALAEGISSTFDALEWHALMNAELEVDEYARAVLHSHSVNAMIATLTTGHAFRVTHLEMMKGAGYA